MTFAQEPATAEFGSMPQVAVRRPLRRFRAVAGSHCRGIDEDRAGTPTSRSADDETGIAEGRAAPEISSTSSL